MPENERNFAQVDAGFAALESVAGGRGAEGRDANDPGTGNSDTGVLHGRCFFFSETGTEGGMWAFWDQRFTGLPAPDQWSCGRCGLVWDRDQSAEPPPARFTYWAGDAYTLRVDEDPDGDLGPDAFNQAWIARDNETARECIRDGHTDWQPMYPNGRASYAGLHVLRDGDELTVYEPDSDTVAWQGIIQLIEYELFTQGVFGMWIHTDQHGIDRDSWARMFLEEWPASLTLVAAR